MTRAEKSSSKKHPKLNYRTLTIRTGTDGRPSSLNEKDRSVDVVGATEAPVEVFDYERWEIVPEVLLMSGCEMPNNRQVPLLDTHSRWDGTGSVLGSYREMRTDGEQLVGRVYFSSVPEAEGPYTKLREGHITDFSAGYRPIESTWVPDGETTIVKGRSFEGPLKVTSRWRIKELSVCPIGADEAAKVRGENNQHPNRDEKGKTMPISEEEKKEIQRIERERITEIRAMCSNHGCDHLAEGMITEGIGLEGARANVLNWIHQNQPTIGHLGPYDYSRHPSTILEDETDKRNSAIIDGLVLRSGVRLENPAPGANEYRGIALPDLARECLVASGVRVNGMTRVQIVKEALSTRAMITESFPFLLANAANKVLRQTYLEAPGSYAQWVNQTDGLDFKEMSRNQLSEAPALDLVPEHGEYTYGRFGESREVFKMTKHGKLFAVTREAIVNDDLGALTRVPRAFAMSAKRSVNTAVYAILTVNAAMSDGKALFHEDHHNFAAGAVVGPPSEETLSAGRLAMRTQTGLKGAILNIPPKYLILSAALETTGDVLLNSIGHLDDDKNAAVVNPFYKKLELVVEPLLDKNDPAKWYLAADSNQIDTVEVCFLDGRKEPYLESKNGWTVDGVEYKVRIEFAVKAIDWRGLFCNDGN